MAVPVTTGIEIPRYMAETFKGGPVFDTKVLRAWGGFEQRFETPRARWYYVQENVTRELPLMQALQTFFLVRHGKSRGFLFWDQMDYDVTTPTDTLQLTATTFRTVKRYTDFSGEYVRELYKLAPGTVHVYNASSVEVPSGWTVDTTTGVITFSSAPAYIPKARFEFFVPVRLDTDAMERDMRTTKWLVMSDLQLEELWN